MVDIICMSAWSPKLIGFLLVFLLNTSQNGHFEKLPHGDQDINRPLGGLARFRLDFANPETR